MIACCRAPAAAAAPGPSRRCSSCSGHRLCLNEVPTGVAHCTVRPCLRTLTHAPTLRSAYALLRRPQRRRAVLCNLRLAGTGGDRRGIADRKQGCFSAIPLLCDGCRTRLRVEPLTERGLLISTPGAHATVACGGRSFTGSQRCLHRYRNTAIAARLSTPYRAARRPIPTLHTDDTLFLHAVHQRLVCGIKIRVPAFGCACPALARRIRVFSAP